MLKKLYISKYVLIDELNISFYSGFSVITGETGAGKSILLGALNLLLGQRADAKTIKQGANKCIVEGSFFIEDPTLSTFFELNDLDFDEKECIIRREIHQSGKSRAFINDSPVNLTLLRTLGVRLIDIHSQHQNLELSGRHFQLDVLDTMADDTPLIKQYKNYYKEYKQLTQELSELRSNSTKQHEEEDYIRFQVQQLQEVQLKETEQSQLEDEAEELSHAEDIKSSLFDVSLLFNGNGSNNIEQNLKQSVHKLQNLSNYSEKISNVAERLQSAYIEIKDIISDVSYLQENIQSDPQRLDIINDRLNLIYSLEQKHHVNSVEELLQLQQNLEEKLKNIESADDQIDELRQKTESLHSEMLKLGKSITQARTQSALKVEDELKKRLIPLGIPNVRFHIEISSLQEPEEYGMDKVSFLFSGNKNIEMQDISQIASGGEIARVMLSLKAMISNKIKSPTILFDEIDTGVSGRIAESMALTMEEMGKTTQVISITHLPQIAVHGKHHYLVYKEDNAQETQSHIVLLDKEQRINEIAHMLSGTQLTQAAINNAKELLKNSSRIHTRMNE